MTAVLDPARGAAAPRAGRRAGRRRQSPFPYVLLAPILVFEVVFVVYPIIRGILLSFHQTSFGVTKFVGLAQYRQMWHDPIFWSSLRTTFEFTFAMTAVWITLGLAVAMLMNWSFPGRGFVRAILAIPWAVPDIPVVLTFLIMLDPNFGILNRFAAFIPGVNHHIQ